MWSSKYLVNQVIIKITLYLSKFSKEEILLKKLFKSKILIFKSNIFIENKIFFYNFRVEN